MTATEEIQGHQERCRPYLLRLRMLADGEGELAPTEVEVGRATSAIVAEARAANQAALADIYSSYPGAGMFLRVRLDRLVRVAGEAVSAAREGDTAGLRRRLHRFEAVTSAIWTAQDAVCGPVSSAGAHAGSEPPTQARSRQPSPGPATEGRGQSALALDPARSRRRAGCGLRGARPPVPPSTTRPGCCIMTGTGTRVRRAGWPPGW